MALHVFIRRTRDAPSRPPVHRSGLGKIWKEPTPEEVTEYERRKKKPEPEADPEATSMGARMPGSKAFTVRRR